MPTPVSLIIASFIQECTANGINPFNEAGQKLFLLTRCDSGLLPLLQIAGQEQQGGNSEEYDGIAPRSIEAY